MSKKIPNNIIDALIDKAIVDEAEQNNMDFGHALKNITPDQLESILGKKKEISSSMIEALADCAIIKESEQDNAEIGHALKNITPESLGSIVEEKKAKIIPFKRVLRERIMWAASIAAILVIAFPVGNHIAYNAKDEGITIGKCETLYAYNISELPSTDLDPRGDKKTLPNIVELTDSQLEAVLPDLEKSFNESEELQEVDINGKILSLAYLKLHKASLAKDVLLTMKERLSSESEDYEDTLFWCERILSQLK